MWKFDFQNGITKTWSSHLALSLITHFVEERKISKDDIQQLRQLLDNLDDSRE